MIAYNIVKLVSTERLKGKLSPSISIFITIISIWNELGIVAFMFQNSKGCFCI